MFFNSFILERREGSHRVPSFESDTGGSSRRSRVREIALRYNQYKSKVARAPSVTLTREPPKLASSLRGTPQREPPKLASSLRGTPQRSPSLSEGDFYGGIYILADTTKVCVDLSVCKPYDFQIITFKDFSTAFVLQGLRAMPMLLFFCV